MLILKLGQWGRNGSGGPTRKLLLLINTEKCQKLELIFIIQEYMSSEIFINPEETHNLCRNIDHLLMERMRSSGQSVTTSELYNIKIIQQHAGLHGLRIIRILMPLR